MWYFIVGKTRKGTKEKKVVWKSCCKKFKHNSQLQYLPGKVLDCGDPLRHPVTKSRPLYVTKLIFYPDEMGNKLQTAFHCGWAPSWLILEIFDCNLLFRLGLRPFEPQTLCSNSICIFTWTLGSNGSIVKMPLRRSNTDSLTKFNSDTNG